MATFDLGDIFNEENSENVSLTDLDMLQLETIFDGDFDVISEIHVQDDVNNSTALTTNDVINEMNMALNNHPPEIKPESEQNGQVKRFKELTENDIEDLKSRRQTKATKKATQWGIKVFQEWSMEVFGKETDFKSIRINDLDNRLGRFYAEAAPKQTESRLRQMENPQIAAEYNKNTFKSIRSAINRYLKDINVDYDIVRDRQFKRSNEILDGKLKKNMEEGLCVPTKHKAIIPTTDLTKINTYLFNTCNPVVLRHRVWYLISIHFVTRGLEIHEQLKKDSFLFRTDEHGDEYMTLSHETKQKNWQGGIESRDGPKEKRMYAIPGDQKCPVKSVKLFLQKTDPDAKHFFNHCSKYALKSCDEEDIWYTSTPIKTYQFTRFMADISKHSKCSSTYTAHCLRATAIQGMNDAGLELRHIMHMSGHRNEASIRSYNRDCSTSQKKHISETLASLTSGNEVQLDISKPSGRNSVTQASHAISVPSIHDAHVMPMSAGFTYSQFLSSGHGFLSHSTFNNCSFQFHNQDKP